MNMKLGAAAVVTLLTVTACGNAGDGDAASPGNGATAACVTQGITDKSISIGASLPFSGPLAVTKPIDAGRSAYFQSINDNGGVNGRKIDYKSYDDQGAPDRTAANARRLVEQDKVFALTGVVGTVAGHGVVDYVKSAKVPFLFPVSGSGTWAEPLKPLVFGFQPVYPDEARMFAHYLADKGKGKSVAVLAQADDAGTEWVDPFLAEAKSIGIEPVAVERFDVAAQSVGSQVLNLRRSGADTVVMFGRTDVVAKVLQEGSKIGYDPTLLVSNIGFSVQLFDLVDPKLAEGTLFANYYPSADSEGPALQQHQAAMEKYQPGVKIDAYTMLGWASATTIVESLNKAGQSLTCESFLKAMESLSGFDTGLTPPITMSATDHQAVNAQEIVEVQSGSFKSISDFLDPQGKPVGK
ncbi:ABC transporter substrate-binding protein [Microtetraspora sp. NBRC 16547]|uniref:ABC transporter substrate-binding protein n=1 Tax=Microtetraspora sp. NBRC 16547 TaxID=3030993 RepID=UPI0024A062AB|nr:ABC transporter substrate-binding protein [Microtetraspora sp. NBRC 16547]GLW99337.1 branched-chain amino acid ABC transporter substrate-binding protein [Microtetraspora sp. NBRC 16547]